MTGKPRPLIINALGALADPNTPPADRAGADDPGSGQTGLSDRVLRDAHASGLTAVNVTIGAVTDLGDPFQDTMADLAAWDTALCRHSGDLLQVREAADLSRARDTGRIGVIYGVQNTTMLGADASRVAVFAERGVRIVQLTYNPANRVGGGSQAPADRPLTDFGQEVVAQLNHHHLMVDLSHSGTQTCLDAIHASTRPVSINHTGCRALVDLPRNKTDAELRLVAEQGGFIGIYSMPFLSTSGSATAEDVVEHIRHALNVCGEDHVGIGTDGTTTPVDDLAAFRRHIAVAVARRRNQGIGAAGETPDTLPFVADLSGPGQFTRLATLLAGRGVRSSVIDKVLGANFLRYAHDIWDH
ncbi:dipeptidase [Amycolatopsis sp. EV170708-02-1]|uniref:dipeptidase n=1 Tax=Amycolatopsis sp. EV170708-02-1 TaxID=2919322 RepID=UPI001F0C657C|nr:membrane dipeptidase [Amycolatopsis sp. EV170708-02-1]UMP00060.1 dipeptidase [Amycolatopsis sp. EV170708-02-1]